MSRFDVTDARSERRAAGGDRVPPADRPSGIPMERLSLPRGPERQPVQARDQVFRLRESEARTLATIEGIIRAREASFKRYQIDISEFRERRFGAGGGGGTDPEDKFGDVFLVIDNFGDLYDKDNGMGDRAIAIARQGLS